MERLIEACAQTIVAVLKQIHEVNVLRLSEQVGERSIVAYQALGWLAREGRIRYTQRQNQVYVSLLSEGEMPPDARKNSG